MYETILRLYTSHKITELGVQKAVLNRWISSQQAEIIIKGGGDKSQ